MRGIGYKEIIEHLSEGKELATAVEQVKQATRNFAKRQLTFYRRMSYITWFDVDKFGNYNNLLEAIYKYVAGKFCIR